MIIKEISIDDVKYMNEIIEMEKSTFGKLGGVDLWILKPIINFGKVFVVLENDKVIGAAEFLISFDSPHAFLYGISIHNLYQNKGIANSLLKFCANYFLKKGIINISLTVDPKNIKAIFLYKKNDYHITSLKENEYGKGIHRFIMEKKLS
ncbi:GNAT family N-acetyltransferase [Fusobacterium sp. MFO224]|uniref:GNAT family N-acetyltransferase n=1 Tax=Fusobacterium sp. MFO224 TaxID=3378070 RepID=UPI003853C540